MIAFNFFERERLELDSSKIKIQSFAFSIQNKIQQKESKKKISYTYRGKDSIAINIVFYVSSFNENQARNLGVINFENFFEFFKGIRSSEIKDVELSLSINEKEKEGMVNIFDFFLKVSKEKSKKVSGIKFKGMTINSADENGFQVSMQLTKKWEVSS